MKKLVTTISFLLALSNNTSLFSMEVKPQERTATSSPHEGHEYIAPDITEDQIKTYSSIKEMLATVDWAITPVVLTATQDLIGINAQLYEALWVIATQEEAAAHKTTILSLLRGVCMKNPALANAVAFNAIRKSLRRNMRPNGSRAK